MIIFQLLSKKIKFNFFQFFVTATEICKRFERVRKSVALTEKNLYNWLPKRL